MAGRYFPELYPDELIYSAVARYHHHCGRGSIKVTILDVLGDPNASLDVECPNRITRLADVANMSSPLRIINNHTSISYYSAFKSPSAKQQIMKIALGAGKNNRLVAHGLNASDRKKKTFHFCPVCEQEMVERYGEAYWLRDHQLPTVYTCLRHDIFLHDSGIPRVSPTQSLKTPAMRQGSSEAIINDVRLLPVLTRLSHYSSTLLRQDVKTCEAESRGSDLSGLFRARGYVLPNQMIDTSSLANDLYPYFRDLASIFPSIAYNAADKRSWIYHMHHGSAESRHVVFHVLIRDALLQMPTSLSKPKRHNRDGLFGSGPWICVNPLADHYNQHVVQKIDRYMGLARKEGAVFTCSCGCVYRQMRSFGKEPTAPRVLDYGPQMHSYLAHAIVEGWSLNRTSKTIKVHRSVIVRCADMLGLNHQWSQNEDRKANYREVSRFPSKKKDDRKRSTGTVAGYSQSEIKQLDEEFSVAIRKKSSEIMGRRPFQRSSKTRIRRELASIPQVAPARLPLVHLALAECSESVEEFRRRRLFSVMKDFADKDLPSISRLSALIGCPQPKHHAWVEEQISQVRDGIATAGNYEW